jgi:hypothetical protein
MGGRQYQIAGYVPAGYAPYPYPHAVHGVGAVPMQPGDVAAAVRLMQLANSGYPQAIAQAVHGVGGYAIGGYQIGDAAAAGMLPPGATPILAANPLQPGQFALSQQDPTERRQLMLGFDSVTDIAGNTTVNVPTTVQDVFRGNRLVIPGSIAASFIINDIRIGTKSQLSSVLGMPAESFVPEALSPIRLDTAQIGQQITINVTNRSQGAQRFLATLYGDAAR